MVINMLGLRWFHWFSFVYINTLPIHRYYSINIYNTRYIYIYI